MSFDGKIQDEIERLRVIFRNTIKEIIPMCPVCRNSNFKPVTNRHFGDYNKAGYESRVDFLYCDVDSGGCGFVFYSSRVEKELTPLHQKMHQLAGSMD